MSDVVTSILHGASANNRDVSTRTAAFKSINSQIDRSHKRMDVAQGLKGFNVNKDDEYNQNGSMAVINSNATVTHPYGYNKKFTASHWHSQGQIMFASSAENSNAKFNRVYQFCGLSMLNYRLKHDLAFASRFDYHTAERLMQNWSFIGVETAEDENPNDSQSPAQWQTLVIHGRVQLPNYWVSLESRLKSGSAVKEGDQVYFLLKRFKKTQFKRSATTMMNQHQTSMNPMPWKATADEFFWQYVPYVSTNGCRPSVTLYSEPNRLDRNDDVIKEGYIGACIFIGSVHLLYATKRMTMTECRARARNVISPQYDNSAYLNDFVLLPTVQLLVRQ